MPTGRQLKFAYFACEACGATRAYKAFLDETPTWRCTCGNQAAFLGFGNAGRRLFEAAKADREMKAVQNSDIDARESRRIKLVESDRDRRERDQLRMIENDNRKAGRLAESVLDSVRNAILARREQLTFQSAQHQFDRQISSGLRAMFSEDA